MMKARWSFSLSQMAYEAEEKKTKRQGSKKKYNFDHFRIEIKIKIMSGSKKIHEEHIIHEFIQAVLMTSQGMVQQGVTGC